MKRFAALLLGIVALAGLSAAAWAQSSDQASFTIAPPPLAYPDYTEPGTAQHKLTGTYITVSVEDFDLTGYGVAYNGRKVLDKGSDGLGQGIGFSAGVFFLSGSGDDFTVDGIVESFSLNYEKELMNKDGQSAIFFVGPAISTAYLYGSGGGIDIEATTFLLGPQIGAQLTFASGELKISPWAMYQSLSGSASVTVSGAFGSVTEDADVSVSTTAFGFDVLHVPSNFTLSGLMQNAGGDSDAKVTIISFSYTFGSDKAADPPKTARRVLQQDLSRRLASR